MGGGGGGGGCWKGRSRPGGVCGRGDVPPPAPSAETFEEILYLVYEASWFHMHHAVAALQ